MKAATAEAVITAGSAEVASGNAAVGVAGTSVVMGVSAGVGAAVAAAAEVGAITAAHDWLAKATAAPASAALQAWFAQSEMPYRKLLFEHRHSAVTGTQPVDVSMLLMQFCCCHVSDRHTEDSHKLTPGMTKSTCASPKRQPPAIVTLSASHKNRKIHQYVPRRRRGLQKSQPRPRRPLPAELALLIEAALLSSGLTAWKS